MNRKDQIVYLHVTPDVNSSPLVAVKLDMDKAKELFCELRNAITWLRQHRDDEQYVANCILSEDKVLYTRTT